VWTALGVLVVGLVRIVTDDACVRMLRPVPLRPYALLAFPLRELLLWVAWLDGLVRRRVVWRGNRLWVGPGTVLSELPIRRSWRRRRELLLGARAVR
jgi:ceramide glucosyltransferase